MTVHLPEPIARSVNEAVQCGRFSTVDEALTAAWIAFDKTSEGQGLSESRELPLKDSDVAGDILAMIDQLRAEIPPEEFVKLPADGARQLDHYLYGSPKRTDA